MMFHQSRNMHGIEPMDFLSHQKMAERMLSPSQQQQQQSQMDAKRPRMDGAGSVGGPPQDGTPYAHLQPNFFPIDPNTATIVLSKSEYEAIRQEVVTLKQALSDFRSNVETELNQLKKENKNLKDQISKCTCGCKQRSGFRGSASSSGTGNNISNSNNTSDKMSEDDSNLQTSFDKGLEDEMGRSPSSRSLLDLMTRENKALHQQVSDLERQTHQLRAASTRVPPSEFPSAQAMSFLRELMAYYTILESNVEGNGTKMAYNSGSEGEKSSFNNTSFDSHAIFNTSLASNCSIYGNMVGLTSLELPEAFDVEKGLQVQLLPNYNVWVNKSKLQLLLKEATSLKEGAQLYVLRRLIPLVFTWEELAASRGQGLNCKSTDDVLSKDPLDPTKVLVCKAYMRKFCLETGLAEPLEKSINETFSHQVNYARRKFKRGKIADGTTGSSSSLHTPTPHSDGPHHPHAPPHQMPLQQHHHHNQDLSGDSFRHHHQQQCSDNNGGPTNPSRLN